MPSVNVRLMHMIGRARRRTDHLIGREEPLPYRPEGYGRGQAGRTNEPHRVGVRHVDHSQSEHTQEALGSLVRACVVVASGGSIRSAVELICARFIRLFVSALRLLSGAPVAYKTTNISVRVLLAGYDGLQNVLTANNPDGLVIDFDGIHD
jgi:hypothetical protein